MHVCVHTHTHTSTHSNRRFCEATLIFLIHIMLSSIFLLDSSVPFCSLSYNKNADQDPLD